MRNASPAHHILAPIQTLTGGGVERVLLRLAGEWLAAGRRVTLVIGSDAGPLAGELPAGAEIVRLDDGRYRALAGRVPGLARELAPDVLFCPGNHYSSVGAWTRWRLGRRAPPVVAKLSNSLVRPDMGRLLHAGYSAWLHLHPWFLDALVAMTPQMAQQAIAAMRMPPGRVRVIANPPPRVIASSPAVTTARYILGVGRLAPQKRWDRAITALAALADRSIELVIIGEGEARAALEAQAAALSVGDRVRLPGYVADPSRAIAVAAVVVLTSDFEGVPGVLREALAAGTPVVATDSSVAVREIVASPTQGTIVGRDDGAALVAALTNWLTPGAARPQPVAPAGDPAADYLRLFDELVSARTPA